MIHEKLSHTPGTWNWYWNMKKEDGFAVADCGVFASQYTDMRNARSICRAPRYQTKEQWEADAMLISAAPKLLFILEKIVFARDAKIYLQEATQILAEATGNTNERT